MASLWAIVIQVPCSCASGQEAADHAQLAVPAAVAPAPVAVAAPADGEPPVALAPQPAEAIEAEETLGDRWLAMPAPAIAQPRPAEAREAQLAALRTQLEPIVKVEISFAKRVCALERRQLQVVVDASREALDRFVREGRRQEQIEQQIRGDGIAVFMHQGHRDDHREILVRDVSEAIDKLLSDEQRRSYRKELLAREAFRRQATIENVVAKLDEELTLSVDQRKKLTESLRENWNAAWAPQLDFFVHMNEYLPNVPEQLVVPHLKPRQKAAWRTMQRINGPIAVSVVQDGAAVIDDVDLNAAGQQR